MTYCANVDAGRISCSNSLNMANIRLIRARNPSRPHVRSLRSPFSDRLLVLHQFVDLSKNTSIKMICPFAAVRLVREVRQGCRVYRPNDGNPGSGSKSRLTPTLLPQGFQRLFQIIKGAMHAMAAGADDNSGRSQVAPRRLDVVGLDTAG